MSCNSKRVPLLEGVRVLDFSRVMSGPFCTSMLADMGAEVIKVEMPNSGDEARRLGPYKDHESTYFMLLNRDKQSLTINLKKAEGVQLIKQLVQQCDVLVENFRPNVMRRLGLGYKALKPLKPDLIYASISGFGMDSPLADWPAFDLVIQAMSGLMNLTGSKDGPATAVGESVADVCTGMYAAWGIVAALYNRERTGEGRELEVSMFDSMFSMQLTGLSQCLYFNREPQRAGNRHPITYPVDSFPTQDGLIVMVVTDDGVFRNLTQIMGQPELAEDARYTDNHARNQHEQQLRTQISTWTQSGTTEEILELLKKANVPCAPVWSLGQAVESDHQQTRLLVELGTHRKLGDISLVPQPVRFSGSGYPHAQQVPMLGEHSDVILTELLGKTKDELAGLHQQGVI
ncbi:MAG: CoA transferase [SAR324 cluster bacterium]|nr:CoA transferase [SAR324 cluster bacterium]